MVDVWEQIDRLADEIGVKPATRIKWRQRGVPPDRFPGLVAQARKTGVEGITFEALHEFRRQQRAAA